MPLPGVRLIAQTDVEDAGELDLTIPDASVPPRAVLRFATTVPLDDLRVRVLTVDDRLVDNHASITLDDAGTRVVLTPLKVWPSRACCVFRVDGELERLPSSGGTPYLPLELPFTAEPDPNARPVVVKSPHRRRHHRRQDQ
jgi:hypothetical protein